MNKILVITTTAVAAFASTGAFAQEQGRVLSATPVVQQYAIPQQVCTNEMVYAQRQPTGAGALVGAIVGGLAGSAIGGGSGRAVATAVGAFGGTIAGNSLEAGPPGYQPMQRCTTQNYYENRTVGYDVTYEYAGRRYTTRTANDPGRWIPLTVQPATGGSYGYAPQPPAQGGYYDDRYDNRYGSQGYYDNRNGHYDQSGYQGGYDYYNQPGQPGAVQRGVVVTGQVSPVNMPPAAESGAIDFRNANGEPYRP